MRTNVPSWCDRILWKSYPETHTVCNSYGEQIISSFHFGFFQFNCGDIALETNSYLSFTSRFTFKCTFLSFSGCTDDIVTSDHSPVFATFEVGVTSQFVSKKGTINHQKSVECKLVFQIFITHLFGHFEAIFSSVND